MVSSPISWIAVGRMEEIDLLVYFGELMTEPVIMIAGITAAVVLGGIICLGLAVKIADW